MLKVYSAAQVHQALPWHDLVQALHQAFTQEVQVPARHAHNLGGQDSLLLMPAWSQHALGTKIVTVMPANASRGVATVQALYLLLDRHSGEPVALLDGEALTFRRTAASSALAASYLAAQDCHTMLLVGAGKLAPWMARAHLALRPSLQRVLVWARNPSASQAVVDELRAQGHPTEVAKSLPDAAPQAQLICCATTSTTPLLQGQWLAPGTHLDLVGGFRPDMREVDDLAVQRYQIWLDTQTALREGGDLVQPLQAGLLHPAQIQGDLSQLLQGQIPARSHAAQLTLFKSVGTALEDLAAAQLVVAHQPA